MIKSRHVGGEAVSSPGSVQGRGAAASRRLAPVGIAALLLGAVWLATGPTLIAAPGDVDVSFNPEFLRGGTVTTIAQGPGGSVYVAGLFTQIQGQARTNLARLNADGTPDPTFNPAVDWATTRSIAYNSESGYSQMSSLMIPLSDGSLLVTGWRAEPNGPGAALLVRLDSKGRRISAFAPRFESLNRPLDIVLSAIAVQTDGRIVVAGNFTIANGMPRSGLARLMPDGELDPSFDPPYIPAMEESAWLTSLAVQEDGRVVAGGMTVGSQSLSGKPVLFRLNANGSFDESFDRSILVETEAFNGALLNAIRLQGDQKILLAGLLGRYGPLVRLNRDGTLDGSFSLRSYSGSPLQALIPANDAKGRWLGVGGWYGPATEVHRYNADGSEDATYAVRSVQGLVAGIATLPNDSLALAGTFGTGLTRRTLDRLDAAGVDQPWATVSLPGYVAAALPDADGKIVVSGEFETVNGKPRIAIARLNPDGTLDEGFSDEFAIAYKAPYITPYLWPLTVDGQGRLLVYATAGYSNVVVRLKHDGSPDPSWVVQQAAAYYKQFARVLPDGRILLGGFQFPSLGLGDSLVVRLNPDGDLDPTFPSVQWPQASLSGLDVDSQGRILVSSYNAGLRRLTPDGTRDDAFNPGFPSDENLLSLVVAPDDAAIVVHIGPSTPHAALSRVLADGAIDATFQSDLLHDTIYAYITGFTRQADGRFLVAVQKVVEGGVVSSLTRLESDGGWDPGFQEARTPDAAMEQVFALPDGRILVRGSFGEIGGVARPYIAVLTGGDAAPSIPAIEVQPTNGIAYAGDPFQLSVVATGASHLHYEWLQGGSPVPGGTRRVLEFEGLRDSDAGEYRVIVSSAQGSVTSAVARVQVIPTAPLAVALNSPGLAWFSRSPDRTTNAWVGLFDVSHDGQSAARSLPVGHNQGAVLWTEIPAQGWIQFWWRVSSETNFDFLQFSINARQYAAISGDSGWQQFSAEVQAGDRVMWIYVKDGSDSQGLDCGWVDEVTFQPAASTTTYPIREWSLAPDGSLHLSWDCTSQVAFRVEGSPDLLHWETVASGVCDRSPMEFSSPAPATGPAYFYRVMAP